MGCDGQSFLVVDFSPPQKRVPDPVSIAEDLPGLLVMDLGDLAL